MPIVQVQELVEAGVHYGHRSSRWNPKMRPYIYGKRNLIHIIDLRETVRGLVRAYRFLTRIAAQGSLVQFVGTKRQSQEAIAREASRCWMPYVSERWIGGTFTNFRTIRNRLQRLEELEQLISSGEIDAYSKKRRASLMREMRKIHRNLSGMRTMNRLPGAMIVIDSNREASAVKEARKMKIPTIALIDTDSDPDLIDLAIPGNDDSIRAIDLVLTRLTDAIREGLGTLPRDQQEKHQQEYDQAHKPVVPKEPQPAADEGGAATAPEASAPPASKAPQSKPPSAETAESAPPPAAETSASPAAETAKPAAEPKETPAEPETPAESASDEEEEGK